MNNKDIIKQLNKSYLIELLMGFSLTILFSVAIYYTIISPYSQWVYLFIWTIYIKYVFDSYIKHIDNIRKIKK